MKPGEEIKEVIKERYRKLASKEDSGSRSCEKDTFKQAKSIGYSEEELESVPEESLLGLGCGNPTALAELKEGETVLDLGSGGGFDAFLAARRVGEKGYVIGIDMTEEMIEKARRNALRHGYGNVEFRVGEIENLPLGDGSIDVIISNCVVVHSTDKPATYREAFRVLKPGGRVLISDLVLEDGLPEEVKQTFGSWVKCAGQTLEKKEYLDTMKKVGFRDIRIVAQHPFGESGMKEELAGKVLSVQVKAYK